MQTPGEIQTAFALGLQHHRAGNLADAERTYRRILAVQPNHADALHLLGVIASQSGNHAAALEMIGRAISLNPAAAGDYYSNYGLALMGLGRIDEAITAYSQSLSLRPNLAAAHSNLAEAYCAKNQLDQAVAAFGRAIGIQPDFADAHYKLGRLLAYKGETNAAISAFQRASELRPKWVEAHFNLGNAFFTKCDYVQAIAAYRRAIQLQPDHVDAITNLGKALNLIEQIDESISTFQMALKFRPNDAIALNSLGNAHKDIAQISKAIECYERAVEADPKYVVADSNRVYAMYFDADLDARAVVRQAKVWNERHAPNPASIQSTHANDRSPERRLRVGYLSPYFRNHCQSLFTPGLLANHDHTQFEIFCYADLARADRVTARLQPRADAWRLTTGLSDQALAEMIRADQIDILVDLTMHMGDGRLVAFAHKPAPVQIAWLAYTGTTGVSAIDYRLTDPYLDPPGENDDHYSEKSIRLPHTFWCYDPMGMELEKAPPEPGPLPAAKNGAITFGCLNNFSKINDRVLELWSRVMIAVPNSRLLLLAPPGSCRVRVLETLRRRGIRADRLEFIARQSRSRYLNEFTRIDLCLDTFPCNGHTTSLDSIWMGVPVVSRVGGTAMGRAGFSQLSNLKLTELAAFTDDDFVKIAAELAGDMPRLTELRGTLRQRLTESPIMDGPTFARDVEAAYRQMWREWANAK